MNNVKHTVRQFVLDNFLMGGDRESLGDSDSFLDHRIVDSTGFIELVTYIEQEFDIQVLDEEIVPENLDSLNAIEAFVSRKRAA